MIYLDSAATSFLKPECVKNAVFDSFSEVGNPGRGAHAPTLNASRLVFRTREKLAQFFHMKDPSGVAFTSNVTQALNTVIGGLLHSGDHVISTICEHNSVLRPLYRKENEGVKLTLLEADGKGRIDSEQFREAITDETKAMIIQHASNVTGNVMPLRKISQIAHEKGVILIVDAAQSAGSIPIDMEQLDIDVLCFTGHKSLLGPQGSGGICVRNGLPIPPLLVGGSGVHSYDKIHPKDMPTALEAGTLNVHGIAGLEAAIDWINKTGLSRIHEKEMKLMKQFIGGVENLPGMHFYGDMESRNRVPIVSCNIGDMDAGLVSDILWEDYEICVRAGAHCAPLIHKHFGTERQGAVRFSFSYFNTEEEINHAIQAMKEIAEG